MKAIEMKVTGCGCAATISHYRRIISIEKWEAIQQCLLNTISSREVNKWKKG
jgi:hypothetical protein